MPALWRQGQKDCEWEDSLEDIVRLYLKKKKVGMAGGGKKEEKEEMEYGEEKKGRGRREGRGSRHIHMESLLSDPNNKNQQEGMNEGGALTHDCPVAGTIHPRRCRQNLSLAQRPP